LLTPVTNQIQTKPFILLAALRRSV